MRRFTAATNDRIYMGTAATLGAAGLNGFDWRWGTFAAVVNVISMPTSSTLLGFNDATTLDFYVNSGDRTLRIYDGSNSNESIGPVLTLGVTYTVAVTKATGAVIPRFHSYNAVTNTWTHAAGNANIGDAAPTTSAGMGDYADSASDQLDGEIGAIAAWQGWVMSDQEVERLARGGWARRSPDFLAEFFATSDCSGDMAHTLGRYKVSQTTRTGTSLGTAAKPAGFRPSPQARRR